MMASPRKALRIIGGNRAEKPTFEASKSEIEAIVRFLTFAQADVKYQLDEMRLEPGHSQVELAQATDTAVFITNYIKTLAGGIELMAMRPMVDVTPNEGNSNAS